MYKTFCFVIILFSALISIAQAAVAIGPISENPGKPFYINTYMFANAQFFFLTGLRTLIDSVSNPGLIFNYFFFYYITLEYPGQCWDSDINMAYEIGNEHTMKNSCIRVACGDDLRFYYAR